MATLEVWKEGTLLQELDLSQPREYSVGRLDGSDIQTDHISCSRRHALLTVKPDGRVLVRDLRSAQGTAVAGRALEPEQDCALAERSKLTFGTSTRSYLLRLPPGPASSSAAPRALSVQEKKALLWGGKKRPAGGVSRAHQRTAETSSETWSGAAAALGDSDRQDKFLALMGAEKKQRADASDVARPPDAARAQEAQDALFQTLESQHERSRLQGARGNFTRGLG